MDIKQKKNKTYSRIYFLGVVILLYLILFFIDSKGGYQSLKISLDLAIKLIPTLLIVILLMSIMNYFLTSQRILNYLGKDSGLRRWVLPATAGIISHGSIFLWYPLLKELKDKGISFGLIAVFLYNRAIKIPFLPLIVYYFGFKFVMVLTFWMIITSFIIGKLIELMEVRG